MSRFYPLRRRHTIIGPSKKPQKRVFQFSMDCANYGMPDRLLDLVCFLGADDSKMKVANPFNLLKIVEAEAIRRGPKSMSVRKHNDMDQTCEVMILAEPKMGKKNRAYFGIPEKTP